jgi:hypothetical protein
MAGLAMQAEVKLLRAPRRATADKLLHGFGQVAALQSASPNLL